MLDVRHYVGLDLGQVSDYSALVSLRREQEIPDPPVPRAVDWKEIRAGPPREVERKPPPARYFCNIAERFERGTSYTRLVENVGRLFQEQRFAGQSLVVDGTGVGRPVVDLFRKAGLGYRLVPVTITSSSPAAVLGKVNIDEWGYWHVPKKELVGSVQVLLGTERLEVAPGLRHAATLTRELKNFSYKVNPQTAYVTLEAWRERDHDDLVLALALAAWAGERARQELWVR